MWIVAFQYVVLAAAFVVSVSSRRLSLPIVVLFLPLTQWMPEPPAPGLNALNILLLPVIVRAIAAGRPPEALRRRDPIFLPAAIFLVFVVISWARVHYARALPAEWVEEGGLRRNLMTVKDMSVAFVLYFCARRLTRERASSALVVGSAVTGYLFEAVTGAREFLFSGSARARAHMGQPNRLGHFLAAYLMIPVGWLLGGAGKYFVPAVLAVLAGCLGIVGSVSRGALIATGAAVLVTGTLKRSAWLIVAALVLATSPHWLPQKVMDRFAVDVVEDEHGEMEIDPERESRVAIWRAGVAMIADNPLGVGLDQFPFHLREYGYTGRKLLSSHNIYVQLSAEQGIPAMLAHAWMMLYLAFASYRVSRTGRDAYERNLGIAMLGVVTSFLLSTTFGDGFYENAISGMFWVLAGTLVNVRQGLLRTGGEAPSATAAEGET